MHGLSDKKQSSSMIATPTWHHCMHVSGSVQPAEKAGNSTRLTATLPVSAATASARSESWRHWLARRCMLRLAAWDTPHMSWANTSTTDTAWTSSASDSVCLGRLTQTAKVKDTSAGHPERRGLH